MVLWVMLLIAAVVLFFYVESFVLPKALFKNSYAIRKIKDRGIKVEKRGNEEIVVYEPDLLMRKYVKQYMLVKNAGGKFLMCKIDEGLNYLEYEVIVYGKKNRILTILNVKDRITRVGYTEKLALPTETAYVSVVVSEAGKKRFLNNLFAPIRAGRVLLYTLSSAVAILTLAFTTRIAISFMMGGVFRESVLLDSDGNVVTLVVSLVLSVVNLIVAAMCIKKRNKEIKR